MELMKHQLDAIEKLDSGKILFGGVGTGKTATVLGYYTKKERKQKIVVITTAKKRDSLDWLAEAARFAIGVTEDLTYYGTIEVDSWNNIDSYVDREDCFFIFDEQRLVGNGAWVKAFIKIAKKNRWVLLSATPGDTWMDYAPVFIANGFYKNITDFKMRHVMYAPNVKFPMIRGYINEQRLEILRNDMLVEMPYLKHTQRILNYLEVGYDQATFDRIHKDRWNPFDECPVKDVAEMWRLLRRVVNSDPSRMEMVQRLLRCHDRLIIFYNFDYELEILRTLSDVIDVYEWNGHRKHPVPDGKRWVYLVQYVAGAEAWNCTTTDAMVMWSLTYSYKNFEQVQGRIDRLDTPYTNLYYYIFVSNSMIDRGIRQKLDHKQNFNERKFIESESGLWVPEPEHVEFCQI